MTSMARLPAPPGRLGAVLFVDGGLLTVDTSTGTASLHGADGAQRWSSPLGRILSALIAPDDGGPCVLVVGDGRAGEVVWLERASGAILGRATIDEAAEVARWGDAVVVRLRASTSSGVVRPHTEVLRFESPGAAPTSMSLPLGVTRMGASGDFLAVALPAERRACAFDSSATAVFERAGQLLAVGPRAIVGREGGAVWIRGMAAGEAERVGTDLLSPDAGYLASLRDELLVVCDPERCEIRAIDLRATPSLRWTRTLSPAKRPRPALTPVCTERGVWVTDGAGTLHALSPVDGQVLASGPKVSTPLFAPPSAAPDLDAVAWVEGGSLVAFGLSEQKPREPRPRSATPMSKPTRAPATPAPAQPPAPLPALPIEEDAVRARFELRFRQLVASPLLSVEIARAETRIAGPDPRGRRGEIAFRWLARKGPPRGGELRWVSFGFGAGARFDAAKMAPTPEICPRVVPRTVRWFEDHPEGGDGTGILEDGSRLYGYDNGAWYPLAIDLRAYLALSLAAPGLVSVTLLAAPTECEISDVSAAKRFAAERKKLATSTRRDARALFADVDLSSVEALLDAVASERLKAKADGQRACLVPASGST